MNRSTRNMLATIAVTLLAGWFATTFILWDYNPANWGSGGRLYSLALTLVFAPFVSYLLDGDRP